MKSIILISAVVLFSANVTFAFDQIVSEECVQDIQVHRASILRQIKEVNDEWSGSSCMGMECREEITVVSDIKTAVLAQARGRDLNDPSIYDGAVGPVEMQALCDNKLKVEDSL